MSIGDNDKNFVEDPRYKQCNKEAIIGSILGILNLIWWYGWGYGLGSKPVSEYKFIMGLPTWFFMSSIVGAILFTVLAFIMVDKFFVDMPLERMTEEEANQYIEGVK
ncbi:YhdT family protein [Clostridium sp. Cult2]|uniref:YhdT family protein n=1 Tax=Clostridium sp. Cult2 TaxID=2079003 RepID=UPI001F2CAC9B|nr:YhdT family protein [Clostridium sp. Cult2]MCF6466167.1 DUF997 domain-containing protein [Clostridium sp. Cult2]